MAKYTVKGYRTLEYVIGEKEPNFITQIIARCSSKTTAQDIAELLEKYGRPSEKRKVKP